MIDYQRFADAWPGDTELLRPRLAERVPLDEAYGATPPDGLLVSMGDRTYRAACFEILAASDEVRLPAADVYAVRDDDGLPLMVMIHEANTGMVLVSPGDELPPGQPVKVDGQAHLSYPRTAFWHLPAAVES